jgi:hypothetical protein
MRWGWWRSSRAFSLDPYSRRPGQRTSRRSRSNHRLTLASLLAESMASTFILSAADIHAVTPDRPSAPRKVAPPVTPPPPAPTPVPARQAGRRRGPGEGCRRFTSLSVAFPGRDRRLTRLTARQPGLVLPLTTSSIAKPGLVRQRARGDSRRSWPGSRSDDLVSRLGRPGFGTYVLVIRRSRPGIAADDLDSRRSRPGPRRRQP